MDVPRTGHKEKIRRRRIIWGGVAVALIAAAAFGISRLEPAAFPVARSDIFTSTVERGTMIRSVRGAGTLVPEEVRFIASATEGRVERRLVEPGTTVDPDTVLLELSNPELERDAEDAYLELQAGEAKLEDLVLQLENDLLTQRALAAQVSTDYEEAQFQYQADKELADNGLISAIELRRSELRQQQLQERNQIEKERLEKTREASFARIRSEEASINQLRALYQLRQEQVEALKVRAGLAGVLQQVDVQVGQRVTTATDLARVANPKRLKAELRITETQAKDMAVGLAADIDTRNGIIAGKVSRIDPAVTDGFVTVDVALEGELPRGARPDLSIEGTVVIEQLDDILYLGRPTMAQTGSSAELYRLSEDGESADRVNVQLGRSSVDTIEIVSGLAEGDVVIISDTNRFDDHETIRLQG